MNWKFAMILVEIEEFGGEETDEDLEIDDSEFMTLTPKIPPRLLRFVRRES